MLKHLPHFLIALLLPMLAASCTDDLATQDGPDAAPGQGIVRLSVPGTRSLPINNGNPEEADATEQERAVRDLWFLAYPTADGQGEPVVQRLNTQELTHNYQTFSIEMPFGTYQVYVVANIDGLSTAITEDELNDIILYYIIRKARTSSSPIQRRVSPCSISTQRTSPSTPKAAQLRPTWSSAASR